jgi:CRISPR-associated protein Cas5h
MEILCFNIKGKFAHFRKYYANNTAFSFSIPPRTTMMGIVAAAMGWEKDKYYKKLSSENIHFAIRVLSPLKKSFQRLNFLSIKNLGDLSKKLDSDFRGKGGRIQTPFEVVTGLDLRKDEVEYQIFVKSAISGNELFDEIKLHFLNDKPVFNISLGIANFSAAISDVIVLNDCFPEEPTDDFLQIYSAIPSEKVVDLNFENENSDYNFIEEDLLPAEFIGNDNRELKKMNRLLFSVTDLPLSVKLSCGFYKIKTNVEEINIVFVDD